MNQTLDPAQALQILAKAAELYAAGLDEMARAFAIPNLQAAVSALATLITPPEAANESGE